MSQIEDSKIRHYLKAYRAYDPIPASERYLTAKYHYARFATEVPTNLGKNAPAKPDSDITVTVTYNFPFQTPGIGRLFGKKGVGGHYFFPITSSVTLQHDGPKNQEQRLGIAYASP